MAQGGGVDAADRRHLFRRIVADMLAQFLEILGVRLDVLPVVEVLLDDRVQQRVQQRHVAARVEAQDQGRVAHQGVAARVHHKDLGAALRRLLEEGRRDRVVFGRPAPMTMITSASSAAVKGAVTAPEPIPSISAATEEAWHSRVQ